MSAPQQKLNLHESGFSLSFYCPGCQVPHSINYKTPPSGRGPVWTWNMVQEKCTFSPSVFVGRGTPMGCHSFVTDGNIEFLPDSHHALAGKTVPLPDWPEDPYANI